MRDFKIKDILTGVVIILIIVISIFVYSKTKKDKTPKLGEINNVKTEEIIKKFNFDSNSNKVELKSASGDFGGVIIGSTLLTDLPDPDSGYFYQVWYLEKDKYLSIGKMRLTKSGYLMENIPNNKKIVVSLEKIFDNKVETKILE